MTGGTSLDARPALATLTRVLAAGLLIGTLLLAVGGAMHPMLNGDASAQLRTIGGTVRWREIHLIMLAGSVLVLGGVWVRLFRARGDVRLMLVASLALISLGIAINALDIAYMAGAGWRMAARFQGGDASMVTLYDVTHPIGRVAARLGNAIVVLGALALGWAETADAESGGRWAAGLAWLAAAGGAVGVLFFDEGSPFVLAAVTLLCGWQVLTGLRAISAKA